MVINEFQVALIGIGVVAVTGVWGYNKWQERKHFKLAEKVFKGQQPDVLMDDDPEVTVINVPEPEPESNLEPVSTYQRVEPVFEPVPEPEAEAFAAQVAEPEPEVEPEVVVAPPPPLSPLPTFVATPRGEAAAAPVISVVTEAPQELADPAIEWLAQVDVAQAQGQAITGADLVAAQQALMPALAKPLNWCGCHEISGEWRPLVANDNGRYRRLRAALLLADRQGPVADADLDAFERGVQAIAAHFGASAELPERAAIQAQARLLDDFCAGIDMQVAVHVVHAQGGEMRGSKILGLAQAAGLEPRPGGRFQNPEPDSGVSLSNLGGTGFEGGSLSALTTPGVTFWFDVPRASNGPAAFDRLMTLARQFATALDGMLVDDQRNPLGEPMIAAIRARIGELQQTMAANQITAGGRRAQRLFN